MPRADVDIDDISSAGEEIPYSTPVKANSPKENGNDTNAVGETQTEPEDDDADEDDDEGEDYVVEAIRGHGMKKGVVYYEIKWEGYPEEDNTHEPKDNLLPDAQEILNAYHRSIRGPIEGMSRSKNARKRKSTTSLNETSREPSSVPMRKKLKEASYASEEDDDLREDDEGWLPKRASWDADIEEIETLARDELQNLTAMIKFKNGKRKKVAMNLVYKHCPIPMLKFYEAHL